MALIDFVLRRRQVKRQADTTDPALVKKVDLLESMYSKIFEAQETYAAQIGDLQQQNTEKDRLLIRQGTQLDTEISERGKMVTSLTDRVGEIGQLKAELSIVRQSSEKQGKRIGDLEHEVGNLKKEADLVPPLREQLIKVQLLLNMYYQWAQQLAGTLKTENLPVAELPPLDLEKIEARSWELSQVIPPGGTYGS